MDAHTASEHLRMPVIFVGHGNPMNAIDNTSYSRAWATVGETLPRPKAILSISAHWETYGMFVTAMPQPRTIHDFGGFPSELYDMQYPAPGSPDLAHRVQEIVRRVPVGADDVQWGLDHGTWSVLCRMFPRADIPVVQLSLDHEQPPEFHYALAKELSPLRDEGVLILGSGNVVHNLRRISFITSGYDWAVDFDQTVKRLILTGDHDPLVHYATLGPSAELSIPTNEHYLPMLYILALQQPGEDVHFFTEGIDLASISMRSFWIG